MLEENLIASGDKLFLEGKFSGAEESYKEISDLFLRNWNLGIMHFSLGEYFQAYDNFLRAFENASDKSYLIAKYGLGKTQYELGDYTGARENLERIVQNNSLSEDVREDAEKMLKRMKFGVLNKLLKGVNHIVLKNPFTTSLILGSLNAYANLEHDPFFPLPIIPANFRYFLGLSLMITLFSYSTLSSLSNIASRRKRKGVQLDSLLKKCVKGDLKIKKFLTGFSGKLFYLPVRPCLIFSGANLLNIQGSALFGILDYVVSTIYKHVKERGVQLKEFVFNHSGLLSSASAVPLSMLGMISFIPPVTYLGHLSLKGAMESSLYGKSSGFLSRNINKLSVLGGLISGSSLMQIEQPRFRDNSIQHFSDSLYVYALLSFLVKRTIASLNEQEFKMRRFGAINDKGLICRLKRAILKPLCHFPLMAGLSGGGYWFYSEYDNDASVASNLIVPLAVGSSINLAAMVYDRLTLTALNGKTYFNYFRNLIKGNLEQAVFHYRKIVDKSGSSFACKSGHLKLGGLLLRLRKYEEAFFEFKRADEMSSVGVGFIGNLRKSMLMKNLEGNLSKENQIGLAIMYQSAGRKNDAKREWEEVLKLDDGLMENCLYAEFLTKNRLKGADEQWKRVIGLIAKQPYETEGLDSTHVVKHIKGKLIDYVLKFGEYEELNSEKDLTGKLVDAVRNHSEFIAPDPLTVFNDGNGWILATRYMKHEKVDPNDTTQLKKIIDYMHLIYSMRAKQERRDDIMVTKKRIKAFSGNPGGNEFSSFAEVVLEMAESYLNTIFVMHTDAAPFNWGIVKKDSEEKYFLRLDLEDRGRWHPFMEISSLSLFSENFRGANLVDYYIDRFPKTEKKLLTFQGHVGYNSLCLLRGVQVIPTLLKRKSVGDSVECVFNAVESSLDFLGEVNSTKAKAKRAYDHYNRFKECLIN